MQSGQQRGANIVNIKSRSKFFLKFTSSCNKQDTCKHFCPSFKVPWGPSWYFYSPCRPWLRNSIYSYELCAITVLSGAWTAPYYKPDQLQRTDLWPTKPSSCNYYCIQSCWIGKEMLLFQPLEFTESIYRTLPKPIQHSFMGPDWIPR
jgi:hypothetical protein